MLLTSKLNWRGKSPNVNVQTSISLSCPNSILICPENSGYLFSDIGSVCVVCVCPQSLAFTLLYAQCMVFACSLHLLPHIGLHDASSVHKLRPHPRQSMRFLHYQTMLLSVIVYAARHNNISISCPENSSSVRRARKWAWTWVLFSMDVDCISLFPLGRSLICLVW